jgi:hypothetical protein
MKSRAWPTSWLFGILLAAFDTCLAATPCPPSSLSVEGGTTVSTTCASAAAEYSTNFPATENPLSEGGKWVTGKVAGLDWNNPASASGKVYASVRSGASGSRYDDSIALLSPSFQTFSPDQYAEATVYAVSGYSASHEVELLLRFSIGPHDAHGYEVLWGLTGYIAIVRWNGPLGNYTPLYDPGVGSIPAPMDGDVLRAEISGNTLTVKRNGSTVISINVGVAGGTIWSSGQPGIGFWPVDNATPQNLGWKSFRAGKL